MPALSSTCRGLVPAILTFAACRSAPPDKPAEPAVTPPGIVAGPDGSYDLVLPARWVGHYRTDSLSTAERGRADPGTIVVEYLPSDSTVRPQALMVIAVYDSAVWRAVRSEEGPPPGDSLATHGGKVYVIGLPQSNPFAPNSIDAGVFGALELQPSELPALIRFR